jgi:uncharacterized membrane protein YeaQ/YmgE (transglycosylase-associated protein family)
MHIVWTLLIGFGVGLVAKLPTVGPGLGGFFLTATLGIVASLLATYVGHFFGWYQAGLSAGYVGGLIGALLLVVGHHHFAKPPSH